MAGPPIPQKPSRNLSVLAFPSERHLASALLRQVRPMPPNATAKAARKTSSGTSEIRRLSTLLDMSQTLSAGAHHKAAMRQVLGILGRHHGAVRSAIALLSRNEGRIDVVGSEGPAADGNAEARARLGEGMTGRAMQSGKQVVVARTSREETFPRRTPDRPEPPSHEVSCVCVPILLNRKAVGALEVEYRFSADRDFGRTVKFLGVVASLLAQAIRIQRIIGAERDRLRDENTGLRLALRERSDFSNILDASGPMRQVYEQVAASRLNAFAIVVPPLRERKADLLMLADHFLGKASAAHGKHIKRISPPALDMLMSYHWPGNVRELENAIERAVVVCDRQVVHAHHLPPTLQTAASSDTAMRLPLKDALVAYEEALIRDALKTTRGNRAKAARLLSTTGRIMNYKVRTLGIDWRRLKI